MPRKKIIPILHQVKPDGSIKVRLDHRTVITLSNINALAFWRKRYPDAYVIDGVTRKH